jgi:magnesium-transporting ATPase (P-type)
MTIGNFFTQIVIIYLIRDYYMLLRKKNRNMLSSINNRLNELRHKKYKTVDEQREFINLVYPKRTQNFKFTFKLFLNIVISIITFIIVMYVLNKIFVYLNINLSIWTAILLITVVPLILDYILSKFGLDRHNTLLRIIKK